jgi:nickel/cobalt transporter (NicO) family protein
MNVGPQLLLVSAVATVGVLHTVVPDHWVPITLIARQRGWSKHETAVAAARAGIGHVLSTLAIGAAVWLAGVAIAERFTHLVDIASSLALIGFGGWIAFSAWGELHAPRRGAFGAGHRAPARPRSPSRRSRTPASRPCREAGWRRRTTGFICRCAAGPRC